MAFSKNSFSSVLFIRMLVFMGIVAAGLVQASPIQTSRRNSALSSNLVTLRQSNNAAQAADNAQLEQQANNDLQNANENQAANANAENANDANENQAAGAENAEAAAAGGVDDATIENAALFLENLESNFYAEGFKRFSDEEFKALGLNDQGLATLKEVGATEQTHADTLTQVLTSQNQRPVKACKKYKFDFKTPAEMVNTARLLEATGISAYLGAIPLIQNKDITSAASSIATVESRHQSFIRSALGADQVPSAFDTPLGLRAVATIAKDFIEECDEQDQLPVQPFQPINLVDRALKSGQKVAVLNSTPPADALFCGFINQLEPQFAPFQDGACTLPAGISGETYMVVTKSESVDDNNILAGPSIVLVS